MYLVFLYYLFNVTFTFVLVFQRDGEQKIVLSLYLHFCVSSCMRSRCAVTSHCPVNLQETLVQITLQIYLFIIYAFVNRSSFSFKLIFVKSYLLLINELD